MKKYLILSFLFLLAITPVLAKSTTETGGQQSNTTSGSENTVTASPTRKPVISPTGNQVKMKMWFKLKIKERTHN